MPPRYRRPNDLPTPPRKPRELAALVANWEAKLAADGLASIESPRGLLKDARHRDTRERQRLEEGEAYLGACQDYQRAYGKVMRPGDARIWRLHANGKTVREIATHLGCSKSWVDKRVAHTRVKMLRWRKVHRRAPLGIGRDGVVLGARFHDDQVAAVKEFAERTRMTKSEALRALVVAGVNAVRDRLRGVQIPTGGEVCRA